MTATVEPDGPQGPGEWQRVDIDTWSRHEGWTRVAWPPIADAEDEDNYSERTVREIWVTK